MGSEFTKGTRKKRSLVASGKGGSDRDPVSIQTDILGETHFVQMDIYETQPEFVVEMDMPGMAAADIKVTIQNDLLVIEGIKKETFESGEKINYLCMERVFGPVRRVLKFPGPINPGALCAVYRDGVLVIRAPKVAERRQSARQISIQED